MTETKGRTSCDFYGSETAEMPAGLQNGAKTTTILTSCAVSHALCRAAALCLCLCALLCVRFRATPCSPELEPRLIVVVAAGIVRVLPPAPVAQPS